VWYCMARLGKAGPGAAGHGEVWSSRLGWARRGVARQGTARYGYYKNLKRLLSSRSIIPIIEHNSLF